VLVEGRGLAGLKSSSITPEISRRSLGRRQGSL
jgi:hypothetical protein